MKELDGKGCLYEKSAYVCGILKIKDCNKCKFIDMYKAKHFI